MNAAEQARLGHILDTALEWGDLEAVKGSTVGGNLAEWTRISGAEIIGQLLARKIVLRSKGSDAPRTEAQRAYLKLVGDEK